MKNNCKLTSLSYDEIIFDCGEHFSFLGDMWYDKKEE